MTSGGASSSTVDVQEHAAAQIEYWQGGLRLVAFGMRGVSWSLPQDEATAAMVLGALLARNFADDAWPEVYCAVVREGPGVVVVAEDDLRVAAVRELLRGWSWSGSCGTWRKRQNEAGWATAAGERRLAETSAGSASQVGEAVGIREARSPTAVVFRERGGGCGRWFRHGYRAWMQDPNTR